jgi:hypothetical protein
MADPLAPLVLDLLAWIGQGRPYLEVMDAWKTSCPRLPIWEEANAHGLVSCMRDRSGVEQVCLTAAGRARLAQSVSTAS